MKEQLPPFDPDDHTPGKYTEEQIRHWFFNAPLEEIDRVLNFNDPNTKWYTAAEVEAHLRALTKPSSDQFDGG